MELSRHFAYALLLASLHQIRRITYVCLRYVSEAEWSFSGLTDRQRTLSTGATEAEAKNQTRIA